MTYPLIVKTNQSWGLDEAHFIYICVNEESLWKYLHDPSLEGKELIVEKLVPHNENFLVKAYVVGGEGCYFHIKNSIPMKTMTQGYKFTNTKTIDKSLFVTTE